MDALEKITGGTSSRRSFMTALAAVGVGAVVASPLLAGNGLTPPPPATSGGAATGVPTDGATQFAAIPGRNINEKVLNFALTLEILEADLYRQALNLASGRPLTTALNSNPSSYKRTVGGGGLNATLTDVGYKYLRDFAYVEAAHRDVLTNAIKSGGGVPVVRNPNGYKFGGPVSPNIASILGGILPLEETGVRAYLGALPYITDLPLAQTAASIFSTEARHSAAINYTLGIDPGPYKKSGDLTVIPNQPSDNTLEYFLKPKTVLSVAGAFFK